MNGIAEYVETTVNPLTGKVEAVIPFPVPVLSTVVPISGLVMPEIKPVTIATNTDMISGKGIQQLVCAILHQAVDDVKSLMKAGVVLNGKVVLEKMPRKVCDGMTLLEARETLHFFKDENISVLLRLGGIDIEPKRFRRKLGFDW